MIKKSKRIVDGISGFLDDNRRGGHYKITDVKQIYKPRYHANSQYKRNYIYGFEGPVFEDPESQRVDAYADHPAKSVTDNVGRIGPPECENELHDFKRQGKADN